MFKRSLLGIAAVTVLALGATGCTSNTKNQTVDPEPVIVGLDPAAQEAETPEEQTGEEENQENSNAGEEAELPEENSGEQETPEENTSSQTIEAFPLEGTVGGFEYSITENAGYWQESEKTGYFIDTLEEPDAPYFFFITCGEKNTGGYGVTVTDITVDENENMEITVCFTEPDPGAVVTMAFEYPMTQVTVDRLPADITIKTVDGTELERLE